MLAHSHRHTAALAFACAAFLVPAPAPAYQLGTDATEAVALGPRGSAPPDGGGVRASHARTTSSAERLAASLRRAAVSLYDEPGRWGDVAVLHAHAAALSDLEGREAAYDLILAGSLLWRAGERRYACAALYTAGQVALQTGDPRQADAAFRQASRAGSSDCARHLEEFLERRIVPAPLPVHVDPPELTAVEVEEAKIRPVFARPELAAPALGTRIVRIPSAPARVQVASPSIQLPALDEAVIRPVFPRPRLVPPELPGGPKGSL